MNLKTQIIGGTANAANGNIALVSTDPLISGGLYSITNALGIKLQDLVLADCSASVKVSGAATPGVITFTATVAATNTDYSFWITQVPNGGKLEGLPLEPIYIIVNTQGIASPTPTTIATQVAAAVNAAEGLDVTTSGTTTCIITASAVNPELNIGGINTPGNQTVVQTTASVEGYGTFQYMTNQYAIASGTGAGTFPQTPFFIGTPLTTKTYSNVKLTYRQHNYSNNISDVFTVPVEFWIDESDAAYAQWVLNYNREMANLLVTNYLINKIPAPTAVNATLSAATSATTLAQVNYAITGGLVTSTSAAAVTFTLPTCGQLVAFLATLGITVVSGYSFSFLVDNSLGANTVTLAVATGMTFSTNNSLLITVPATAAGGVGKFTIEFTSATACTLVREW